MKPSVTGGTVHNVPEDLFTVFADDASLLELWEDLTPLARNEWICWVVTCKKPETRQQHIERIQSDLLAGKRRPCCWAGCPHRPDRVVKVYTKNYKKVNVKA